MAAEAGRGLVLVVEDEVTLRAAYERILRTNGWTVVTAADGREARERVEEVEFDVIVSDINMAGYGGLGLLRAIRERDPDVPVIFVTGTPSVETSMRAIELGVFRYLAKPMGRDTLEETVTRAMLVHRLARVKRRALAIANETGTSGDIATLEPRFAQALRTLWIGFQPIVSVPTRAIVGQEALLRTEEPTLASPQAFLEAADRLGRLDTIGRAVRGAVAAACALPDRPACFFVNISATDLVDDDLYDPESQLGRIASLVVLEITERASLASVNDLSQRVQRLKGLGYRLGIDDLGHGYAGLTSFMLLEPDVVKIAMALIRNIHEDPRKQSIVRSLIELSDELGVMAICEGVETADERDMLLALGCEHMQGYLFARPGRGFPEVAW